MSARLMNFLIKMQSLLQLANQSDRRTPGLFHMITVIVAEMTSADQ